MPICKSFPPTRSIICKDRNLLAGPTVRQPSRVHNCIVLAQVHEPHLPPNEPSRRHVVLRSVNVAVLAEAALNQSDPRTIVNSLLGMNSVKFTYTSGNRCEQEANGLDEQVHTDCHN